GRRLGSLKDQTSKITFFTPAMPAYLFTGHEDGMVKIWDRQTRRVVSAFKIAERPIFMINVSPPSFVLVADEDRSLPISELATGKKLAEIPSRRPLLVNWFLTPDGQRLVTRRDGEDGEVRDAGALRLISRFRGTGDSAINLTPAPGNRVATWENNWLIKHWDM